MCVPSVCVTKQRDGEIGEANLRCGSMNSTRRPWWWWRWCFPSLRANPRSERDVGGVGCARSTSCPVQAGPHPLYSAATGAHRQLRSGAPDQGAITGIVEPLDSTVGDQYLTFVLNNLAVFLLHVYLCLDFHLAYLFHAHFCRVLLSWYNRSL